MHRVPAARWLNRVLRIGEGAPSRGLPVYLCPAVGKPRKPLSRQPLGDASRVQRRFNHAEATTTNAADSTTISREESAKAPVRKLPVTCSGCGAFAQTSDSHQLGYYDLQSKRVRVWMHPRKHEPRESESAEDKVVEDVLGALDSSKLKELGLDPTTLLSGEDSAGSAIASKLASV